jgi:nucleotide-binding universal stress UspA family protein
MAAMGTIVVGVDGSEVSLAALDWAADEARLRGSRLVAVHVWAAPYAPAMPGIMEPAGLPVDRDVIQQAASEALDGWLGEATAKLKGVEVEAAVVEGEAAEALVERSEGADLLVVGSRGHGRLAGALLGSISQKAAQHARCPVVIVHPPHKD